MDKTGSSEPMPDTAQAKRPPGRPPFLAPGYAHYKIRLDQPHLDLLGKLKALWKLRNQAETIRYILDNPYKFMRAVRKLEQ